MTINIPFYIAIVFLSCFTLGTLMVLVGENARFPKTIKKRFYATYSILILASLAEMVGIILNGAPEWTVPLHAIVKCLDYICTPLAAVFFIRLVSVDDKPLFRLLYAVLLINSLLQFISIFTGWTFYLDDANYYFHGPIYFIYSIVYLICILAAIYSFIRYGRNFLKKNRVSMLMIGFLVASGVLLQELESTVRTTCLGLTMASVLLFIHYNEFWQQTSDENMRYQKALLERDPLTDLPNRYVYNETLKEYASGKPLEDTFVFVSIDLNGLKTTNDSMGHDAGDELIQGAAECISKVFKPYGTCFRVGGDEFVGMIQVEADKLEKIKADLAEATRNWKSHVAKNSQKGMSLSCGFAGVQEFPGFSVTELMKIADTRMYQEKARYYQQPGVDRRSRREAFNAVMGSYNKILKANLSEDRYEIISSSVENLTEESGFSDHLSLWMKGLLDAGQIHASDQELYESHTKLEYLRSFFAEGKQRFALRYRRFVGEEMHEVLMEMIPAEDYSDEHQNVFLYVKDINV